MTWPRTAEHWRLYRTVAAPHEYLLVQPRPRTEPALPCLGLSRAGYRDIPPLRPTTVTRQRLASRYIRVAWSEAPRIWQRAFLKLLPAGFQPTRERGLWRLDDSRYKGS